MMLCADFSPPPSIICCEPQKPQGAREWWSFREIKSARRWYAGRPGKPKVELRWCYHPSPRPPPEPAPELERSPPANLEPGVGPKIIEGGFEDRWLGLEECRKN